MRTLIIDNYPPNSPQITQLYNVIKDITVHTVEVRSYTTISAGEELKIYDVLILSGSPAKLADSGVFEPYAKEAALLRDLNKPVLGICFGHQLLAIAFGENVVPTGKEIDGYYIVHRLVDDQIFEGLSDKFLVRESHVEMVENAPYDFVLLAESPNCPIEVMRHPRLPIYGVQFHPERFDDKRPAGGIILENFFSLASLYI